MTLVAFYVFLSVQHFRSVFESYFMFKYFSAKRIAIKFGLLLFYLFRFPNEEEKQKKKKRNPILLP